MDISEKDEISPEKMNRMNYESVHNPPADWRISDSNPVAALIDSYPPENLIPPSPSSCSPSQIIDSFGQTLWYDPTNVQAVGYGGFNVQINGGNGLFLPNASSFLPPSMAQFPADPGFIERAARFSLFSPESIGLLQGQCPSNELNVGKAHNDASMIDPNVIRSSKEAQPTVLGSGNVSEDTHSSGWKTSSNTKKRKRNGEGSEADQTQTEEEPDNNGDNKGNDEESPNSHCKQKFGPYIHVRARRGEATNSHSLAERVRREKISERMKFLQDLVPGCNNVIGKAVMLDEIINYVQSLQRQVAFLSMKLATVNPQMDMNLEGLLAKDTLQLRAGYSSATPFPQNVSMVNPLPHGFMQQTVSDIRKTINGGFKRQETNGWGGDLQNVNQINYGAGDVPPEPQAAATGENMKAEP